MTKFKLSEEQIKTLLKLFHEETKNDPGAISYLKNKEILDKNLKKTILNSKWLDETSTKDFTEYLYNEYVRKLYGKIYRVSTHDRIIDQEQLLRDNLKYIVNSDDIPFIKAENLITGSRKVTYFSRAFWTPILEIAYPEELPNWNDITMDLLRTIGEDILDKKLSLAEQYRKISEAFYDLKKISGNMNLSFHQLDHFAHFCIAYPQGRAKINEFTQIGSETEKSLDDSEFQGFTEDTFKYLNLLDKNHQNYDKIKSIKTELDKYLKYPLKKMLEKVAERFDPDNILDLEKYKRVMGLIFKRQVTTGAWPWVWGAFYQKDKPKNASMQLFVSLSNNQVHIGAYASLRDDNSRESFFSKLLKYSDEFNNRFADLFKEYHIYTDYKVGEGIEFIKVQSLEELVPHLRNQFLSFGKIIEKEEAIKLGPRLIEEVYRIFIDVSSYMIIGLDKNPIDLWDKFYSESVYLLEEDLDLEFEDQVVDKKEILSEIFIEEDRFDEILKLLSSDNPKRQIILQGPPGTGKTYVARWLAKYLTMHEKRYEIIQFHPSYSYEDFIEGYRPVGERGFELKPGRFVKFCNEARVFPDKNYIMIIDEINRGNLSKIFGELMYLLEYRTQHVRLTYSGDRFSIPRNVAIIGTMNTADRSLAIMDYALRRRFYFIRLECNLDRLKIWLKDNGCIDDEDHLIRNISEMNKLISEEMDSKDYAIGHSYFMKKDFDSTIRDQILDYEIKPLLEEYFFDKPDVVDSIMRIFTNYE